MPITAFIGVRISWLMLARNALLACVFASAASRARQFLLDLLALAHVAHDAEDAARLAAFAAQAQAGLDPDAPTVAAAEPALKCHRRVPVLQRVEPGREVRGVFGHQQGAQVHRERFVATEAGHAFARGIERGEPAREVGGEDCVAGVRDDVAIVGLQIGLLDQLRADLRGLGPHAPAQRH
jgi:hypothetical protein